MVVHANDSSRSTECVEWLIAVFLDLDALWIIVDALATKNTYFGREQSEEFY